MSLIEQGSESEIASAIIASPVARLRASRISSLLSQASEWRPRGYEAAVTKRRDFFERRQTPYVASLLAKRDPHTSKFMSPYSVPLYRHMIEQLAVLYRAPSHREIHVDGAYDEQATMEMRGLYRDAMIDAHMQHAEHIAACAGIAFVRLGWDAYDETLVSQAWWPDSVFVLPHPDWPTRVDRAVALIAQLQSADGLSATARKRYEVWERIDTTWVMSVVDERGIALSDPVYTDFLPWVTVADDSRASLYELVGDDDIIATEIIGALISELHYCVQMQAHTQTWYSGASDPGELVGGPGTVFIAGEGGTFGTISYTPQIAAVQSMIDETQKRMLVSYGVPPDSVSIDPSYQSGVALKVQRAPLMERRTARIPAARVIEQRRLWPVVAAVYQRHTGRVIPGTMSWSPAALEIPLDDEAQVRLAKERIGMSLSTPPIEMVRLGLAEDEGAAIALYTRIREYIAAEAAGASTDQTLAGAQTTAITEVVARYARREISRASAIAIIQRTLGSSADDAALLVGPEDFTAAAAAAAPQQSPPAQPLRDDAT